MAVTMDNNNKEPTSQLKHPQTRPLLKIDGDGSGAFLLRHNQLAEEAEPLLPQQQCMLLMAQFDLSEEEIGRRERFLGHIQQLLCKGFQGVSVEVFGSYFTELASKDSDVDVLVLFHKNQENEEWSASERMRRVFKFLKGCNKDSGGQIFSSLIPIPARIPIIQVEHLETAVKADLSFSSRLSRLNSELLRFYLEYDVRVRPFLLCLRYWGKLHQLTGSQKIKMYALMLLGVVSLNLRRILPCVHFLQGQGQTETLCGWNAGFARDGGKVRALCQQSIYARGLENISQPTVQNVYELLLHFFELYGNLDFMEYAICPHLGNKVPKSVLQRLDEFEDCCLGGPREEQLPFCRHDLYGLLRDSGRRGGGGGGGMVVQDPFVLNYNVAGLVSGQLLDRFQSKCRAAALAISSLPEQHNLFRDVLEADLCQMKVSLDQHSEMQ